MTDDNFEACALTIEDNTSEEIHAILEKVFAGGEDVFIEESEQAVFEAFSACMEVKETEALQPTFEAELGVSETLEERLVNLDKRVEGIITKANARITSNPLVAGE